MDNYKSAEHNGFGVAALICGLMAFLTSFMVVFVPFGAGLAFTFGFLSRGDRKMCTEARLGIFFAVLAVIAAAAVSIFLIRSFSGLIFAGRNQIFNFIGGMPGRMPGFM